MEKEKFTTRKIVYLAVMAAIVCAVTFFRFPLLGSKVHFANAMCLLAGLLFGGVGGGLAAGLGSGLYDALFGGYDFAEALVTFATKFLMAYLCAAAAGCPGQDGRRPRAVLGCAVGAVGYVALYMLKTYLYQRFVYGFPLNTTWATMLSKLPASAINAAVAVIAAPVLYAAILPALRRAHLLDKT